MCLRPQKKLQTDTDIQTQKDSHTQLKCSSKASDNCNRVGRISAELVKWGKERIPLALQLWEV